MVKNKSSPEQNQHVKASSLSRRWVVAAFGAVFALGALLAVPLWPHILWKINEIRFGLPEVQAVPTTIMPPSGVPEDWVRHHFDGMEVMLPPGFTKSQNQPNPNIVVFDNGSEEVNISMPEDADKIFNFVPHFPEAANMTIPRLRSRCYRASSADFRWSMSRSEIRWHMFCLTIGKVLRLGDDGRVETMFHKDMEGIAYFDESIVSFGWQRVGGKEWGYINFMGSSVATSPAWVRAVCESVKIVADGAVQKQ